MTMRNDILSIFSASRSKIAMYFVYLSRRQISVIDICAINHEDAPRGFLNLGYPLNNKLYPEVSRAAYRSWEYIPCCVTETSRIHSSSSVQPATSFLPSCIVDYIPIAACHHVFVRETWLCSLRTVIYFPYFTIYNISRRATRTLSLQSLLFKFVFLFHIYYIWILFRDLEVILKVVARIYNNFSLTKFFLKLERF